MHTVLVQPFHEAPPAKWPFVSTSRIACPTLTFYNETLLDGWVSLSSQVAFWPTV